MAWKQSLAKIKKDLQDEPNPKAAPRPKPRPPQEAQPIEDEDALFLSVMGAKTRPVRQEPGGRAEPRDPPREAPPPPEPAFGEAMADLKGLRPLRAAPPAPPPPVAVSPTEEAPPLPPERVEVAEETQESVDPPVPLPSLVPQLIHLAAGMAIVVDGTLDLRGHSVQDALERLRERVQDGAFLGWRSLHVLLGGEEDLLDMLMEYLRGQDLPRITRYAQAPIPMGGSQAWILYFSSLTP
jgi:hypothetical protein